MSFHESLGYSTLALLISHMTLDARNVVEIVLYDYLRCNIVEYDEFLDLMDYYHLRCKRLEEES